ncbi:hypothetical protein, partial [Chamaesiphon sp. VAR_69_metabat_338]|uniref:hypothetical protein n=1 Tax=Chamaesiphon sp. VAR_69_metabat_338 TaxID=2964704 RepID=UPI00286DA247
NPAEIATAKQLLQDYAPAQTALTLIAENNGDLAAAFDRLATSERNTYSDPTQSIWEATLTVLRRELCRDEGFRGKVKEYTKNPTSAVMLTGIVHHLVAISHLQLDPSVATFATLYISRIGLDIFCEHTKPSEK